MLEQIFLKVMDMSRMASMVIVAVFLVRILLKRFPKYISYLLWSVVLFRLLCPITLESDISPVPNLEPVFYDYTSEKNAVSPEVPDELVVPHTDGETEKVPEIGQVTPAQTAAAQFHPNENVRAAEVSWQELFILFGKYVWLAGIGIMLLYCVISAVMVRNKVSASIPLKENIYMTDEAISPFVMGILRPRIYLPEGLSEKEQEYIILHEKFHIRRFDHVVKPVAFAALCIHWFNPLVWIAFVFFCKDMEMSCDEAVIKRMGETVRADYSASLLTLSTQRRIVGGFPVDFGEGDTKDRVKNLATLRKTKRGVMAVLIAGVAILIVCLAFTRKTFISDADVPRNENHSAENGGMTDKPEEPDEPEPLYVSLDITEFYVTHKGAPSYLYYIDENNVLWGCGRNNYGQLGQGTQDYDFHEDKVKIAEHVVHVDYSQKGFVIFLTKDYKLYGFGNAGCGALQQYAEFDWNKYVNGEHYYVSEPCLLMEDVMYACCGRDDIVCLKEDGTVWTWGTIYAEGDSFFSTDVYYIQKPEKILENAVLITGGWFNHAALLHDGTVWTWGYNGSGNCGVADLTVVAEPTMVAEEVVMVWTDFAVDGYPQPGAEEAAMAWTGGLKYNTEHEDIAEFGDIFPKHLNNTVIRKADGSYWVCGENVGTEEKMVPGAEAAYPVICTHEFTLCLSPETEEESVEIRQETLADKVLSYTQSPTENLYFLMATEETYESKVVRIDEEDTGSLLRLFQDITIEKMDGRVGGECLYTLLLYDETQTQGCMINVYDNYVRFNWEAYYENGAYYETSGNEFVSILDELYATSEELQKLSPEEVLLSTSVAEARGYTEKDIFYVNGKPALPMETGYGEMPPAQGEWNYETYLCVEGIYFNWDGAAYQVTYFIDYWDDNGVYMEDGYSKIWNYYDYATNEWIGDIVLHSGL